MAYYETDIPVVGGGTNNDSWGNGAWWIIILLLFGWGRGFGYGNGNNGGGEAMYVDGAIQRGFDTQSIISKLDGITYGLSDGFYAQNTNLLNGFASVNQQVAACCCNIREQIADVNYNMARNTCDIIQAGKDNTQRIIDYMTTQTVQQLRDENATLRLAASQTAQNNQLINALRPTAVPAYLTCSPYQSVFGFGNSGCSGSNTIL